MFFSQNKSGRQFFSNISLTTVLFMSEAEKMSNCYQNLAYKNHVPQFDLDTVYLTFTFSGLTRGRPRFRFTGIYTAQNSYTKM